MKRILYTILFILSTIKTFAATNYDCSNPNSTINYNNAGRYPPPAPQTGTYKCGYETNTPTNTYACSYYYNNKAAANAAGYTISNCQHNQGGNAPINVGPYIFNPGRLNHLLIYYS
jgi:hypothetical protein